MKHKAFFISVVSVVALASCSGKTADAKVDNQKAEVPAPVEQPVATDAEAGKVIELTDPKMLAPGVKVERLTVVDFNASWCGPCRQLGPVVEEMAEKYAGKADFISVDVDKYGILMDAWKLGQAIPVVLFLKPDGTSSHYVGTGELLPAAKFEKLIEDNLK